MTVAWQGGASGVGKVVRSQIVLRQLGRGSETPSSLEPPTKGPLIQNCRLSSSDLAPPLSDGGSGPWKKGFGPREGLRLPHPFRTPCTGSVAPGLRGPGPGASRLGAGWSREERVAEPGAHSLSPAQGWPITTLSPLQSTQLKLTSNPFAKGFRESDPDSWYRLAPDSSAQLP